MTRPRKDMTQTTITREQMLALLQGDDALRALLQTTVQEVLEAEMDDALAPAKASAPANGAAIVVGIMGGS